MLTYILFKTQSMLLSATSRKGQPHADLQAVQNPEHAFISNKQEGPATCCLHTVQNPEHALVSNKQEMPVTCWLTSCSKPTACSCQPQARRASHMLTYILFKTQSMLLSVTNRKGQLDANLHTVQNPEHVVVSEKAGPARCSLTSCSGPRACSCKQQVGRLARSAHLHPVQGPEHVLVSNKQEGPARCWLTSCSEPKTCSCQQQAGRTSQMLTYILFKTQSMLLSATGRKDQADADLHPVENPEHAVVSNQQEGPATCWLTVCSNPQHALVSNKQEEPARCWLTCCSKPRAWCCQ